MAVRDPRRQYIVPRDEDEEVESEEEGAEEEKEKIENKDDVEDEDEQQESEMEKMEIIEDMDLLEESLEDKKELTDDKDKMNEDMNDILGTEIRMKVISKDPFDESLLDDSPSKSNEKYDVNLSETPEVEEDDSLNPKLGIKKEDEGIWETVDSLPKGWKYKDYERSDGKGKRAFVQAPDTRVFPCRRLALR